MQFLRYCISPHPRPSLPCQTAEQWRCQTAPTAGFCSPVASACRAAPPPKQPGTHRGGRRRATGLRGRRRSGLGCSGRILGQRRAPLFLAALLVRPHQAIRAGGGPGCRRRGRARAGGGGEQRASRRRRAARGREQRPAGGAVRRHAVRRHAGPAGGGGGTCSAAVGGLSQPPGRNRCGLLHAAVGAKDWTSSAELLHFAVHTETPQAGRKAGWAGLAGGQAAPRTCTPVAACRAAASCVGAGACRKGASPGGACRTGACPAAAYHRDCR